MLISASHFNCYYFMISFLIGLLFVYLFSEKPKLVYQHPTPENAGKIIYMDDNGACYKYTSEKITCPN